MKKILLLVLCISFSALAQENAKVICSIDEGLEDSTFYCMNKNQLNPKSYTVPKISHKSTKEELEEKGAQFISLTDYLAQTAPYMISSIQSGPNSDLGSCFEGIAYKVEEFNNLSPSNEAISRLKVLALSLHQSGICKTQVYKENYLNIGIENSDDLIQQFLCISNNESSIGRDNLGIGGRGPWGINPMHNAKPGSLCYQTSAVMRNPDGSEDKNNNLYMTNQARLDNASCAIKLYNSSNGFRDWGKTTVWGSNRHCSSTTRHQLQFKKFLGALSCCTDACLNTIPHEKS